MLQIDHTPLVLFGRLDEEIFADRGWILIQITTENRNRCASDPVHNIESVTYVDGPWSIPLLI